MTVSLANDVSSTSRPIGFNAGEVPWVAAPPTMPRSSEIAVLEGDPHKPAFFTMRIKVPAGGRLDPHTHPEDERVTIISGSIHVGFGEKFDPAQGKTFTAGAFYVNPTPMPHYVWTDEGCVIQVTGIGPWSVNFVKPASAR